MQPLLQAITALSLIVVLWKQRSEISELTRAFAKLADNALGLRQLHASARDGRIGTFAQRFEPHLLGIAFGLPLPLFSTALGIAVLCGFLGFGYYFTVGLLSAQTCGAFAMMVLMLVGFRLWHRAAIEAHIRNKDKAPYRRALIASSIGSTFALIAEALVLAV